MMLAWVSIAPFGRPVVPPVYCSSSTSSAERAGQADGGVASSSGVSASNPAGVAAVGDGPQNPSGATITRDAAPVPASHAAFSSNGAKSVVMTVRAPLSASLCASSRRASREERCTIRAPVRARAKNSTGCHGVLGRRSATVEPAPIPSASSPTATRSATARSWA